MRKRAFIILAAFFSLTGCISDPAASLSSFESSLSYSDPYDDPDLTEEYLEKNLCMVFKDLRFIKGEKGKNDHAFVIKDGKVAEHRSYGRKEKTLSLFQPVVGLSLFEAMETIGIPSFRGRYDEDPSLTYVISPEAYVTIYIEKNIEGKWAVSSLKTFDEKEFSEDFGRSYTSDNVQKANYVPSYERVRSIQMGMLFDNVLFILGRPSRGTYHGFPSKQNPGGSWNLELRKHWVDISARWVGSDYPAFEKDNCPKGYSSYFGVCRVYIPYYLSTDL